MSNCQRIAVITDVQHAFTLVEKVISDAEIGMEARHKIEKIRKDLIKKLEEHEQVINKIYQELHKHG